MSPRKRLGFIFIFTAALGFLIGLVSLFAIWYFRPVLLTTVSNFSIQADASLSSLQDGLDILGQEVDLLSVNMQSLLSTTQVLSDTLRNSGPILNSLGDLTSRDLPNTITSTQTALLSAQGSALLIDNMLSALSSIPLINIAPYKPEVPLHTSLGQISTSLNALRPSLASINANLTLSKNNLAALEKEMATITETTRKMNATFTGVQTVVDQYKASTQNLSSQIRGLQSSAPVWINTLAVLLTIGDIWFLLAQFSLLAQGSFLLGRLSRDTNNLVG